METNHWGVTVHSEMPITGVATNNAIEFLGEEMTNAIDLAWEEHQEECKGQCGDCHCNHDGPQAKNSGCSCYEVREGVNPSHAYDPQGDEHEFCGPEERGTLLIGSWKKDAAGKWMPNVADPEKKGYAAIVGETYTQVVWSKTIKRTRLCSPCYPGQGDLDSDGPYLTFDLPASLYGKEEAQSQPKQEA